MIRFKNSWKTGIAAILLSVSGISALAADIPSYDRKEWKHWRDLDRDCEDTREEALKRDATYIFYTNKSCTPVYGVWLGSYTDEYFFAGGNMDADHIIPLEHAHYAGGHAWPSSLKKEFANDLENVIMASASANRSKGSRGPAEWMPPNAAYHCEYIKKWNAIKQKYHLTSTAKEALFIGNIMLKNTCK